MRFAFPNDPASNSLALRIGSVALDLTLWAFLSSTAVSEFFAHRSHPPGRAFEVIVSEPGRSESA
jgi:hypothetical protein